MSILPIAAAVLAVLTGGAEGASICDESVWPDKELDCGECRVLVGNFNSNYA